jgi:uncharacterized ion transporter superfamily protein YfcC
MPDVLTLLFGVLALCVLATYILPAGEYQVGAKDVIIPGTYERVANTPVSVMAAFTAIHTGMVKSAPIIFGILFTGGALAVLDATGSLRGAVERLAGRAGANTYVLLTLVMLFFGVTAVLGVITSEVIAFFPIGFMVARAFRLDVTTGLLIVILPNAAGYSTSFLNPSSLALAQTISGLPLFSGMGYRLALFVVFMLVTVAFVLLYVRRIVASPERALLGAASPEDTEHETAAPEFSTRHKLALGAFVLILAVFVVGTSMWSWGVGEMSACFVLVALVTAIIFRMSSMTMINHFIEGMRGLLFVTLVIGVARAITVVLEDGHILDSLVFALDNLLGSLTSEVGAVALLGMAGLVNFFVGSGTGQAALTMPVIAPLTDLMQIPRQVGVLTFQLGDGITNLLFPTSAVLMAGLAMAGIPFGKWVRFVAPYLLILTVLAVIAVSAGVSFGYH